MSLLKSYRTLKEYRRDPLGFIQNLHRLQGHRARLEIFGKKLFIVSHPDDVVHVLKTNNGSYTKGRTTKALRRFLGNGLITNEGESWRKQHRMIRPVMNLRSVFDLAPKMLETVETFLPSLDADGELDGFHQMNRLTWRIILRTLFSQEPTAALDEWLHEILELMRIMTAKTRSSIPVPFWIPTAKHRRLLEIISKFDRHVFGLINERRCGTRKQDLLQLLIDAQEEGTAQMSDREIRDEIMTFMMAGHETITNSLTYTLIEIAKHPETRPELEREAHSFFFNRDFENLNTAPWHGAVLDEVMRLWPPVWVFMRQAEVSDELGDLEISPGANVVLAPILSHRAADLWDAPLEFRPSRFLPEEKKKIPVGAYYPFGLGPRACIGAYFAGLEARIILACLVQHFTWDIANPEPQRNEAGISLRPTNNIRMRFRRRA